MKKIRGFADPITLGFVLIALGSALAAKETARIEASQHNKVVKTQVVAPQHTVANNNTVAKTK